MAAAKKKKKPSRRVLLRRRRRERWIASRRNPEHRAFLIWVHDLDTILHELLRNPAIVTMSNDEVLARAIEFFCEPCARTFAAECAETGIANRVAFRSRGPL